PTAAGHALERLGADRPAGLFRERQVERHELRGGVDILRCLGPFDAELAEALLGHERVIGDDAHSEPQRAACHLLADPTEPEHAEPLALELDTAVARALPAPLLQRSVRLRDVP